MKKTILSILTIMIFTVNGVSASILGPTLKDSSSIPMGRGLTLNYNKFLSDQKGVGNQSEYYAEYTPNTDVVPTVLTGEDIYGKRTASQAVQYMQDNSMVPMLGINASYFSFQTGIPMGHVITDGVVTSKDDRTLPGIGFRKDSSAFIADMYIETNAVFGEDYVLQIPHINKYISAQTQMLTLFTPDFGDSTGTSTETLNVILENPTDNVRIGSSFTCTVGKIFKSSEPVKINDGQFILSINTAGNQWAVTLMNTMQEGEVITVKTNAGNEIWNEAYNGLASEGERLLINGEVAKGLEAGASPRTAVGIKPNGNVIFYVIDGRQSGHSYGARKDTVAKRLKELGCVEALNLDGGGSTTMTGVYPGCDTSVIINTPSEGSLRKVTNFIFLKNAAQAVGKPEMAYIYPYAGNILSGSTVKLDVKTVDINHYKTEHGEVSYSSNEYGTVSQNGELTVLGEGVVRVEVHTSGLTAAANYKTYITPDNFRLYNAQNMVELNQIDVNPGDTVYLKAEAVYDGEKLISSNSAYRWSLSDTGEASVDSNGVLTIGDSFTGTSVLTVKAGGKTKTFKVVSSGKTVSAEAYPYSEISVNNNVLTIDMFTYNDAINKERSYYKIDGQRISFADAADIDAKHARAEYSLDEGFSEEYHKIFCVTVLNNGYSAINSYDITAGDPGNIFADTQNHWAKNTISYMNSMGIVNGSEENGDFIFRPDGKITRCEFAVMAVNALGLNLNEYSNVDLKKFVDFNKIPDWAADYVKAACEYGIISGKSEVSGVYFAPNEYITRAEAATIISRMLPSKLAAKTVSYKDSTSIPDWALKPIKVLNTANLIKGYDDNTIKPQNNVTRAEAATMLYNIF